MPPRRRASQLRARKVLRHCHELRSRRHGCRSRHANRPTVRPGRRCSGLAPARVSSERVNVVALRDLTDESGGRTEIVRESRDLDPATANIAAELSQQYYLGYPASGKKDGKWHAIRVEAKNSSYRVRARRGYVAN